MRKQDKYLAVVCNKYTTEMISEIYEIEEHSVYSMADIVESLSGIKVDGRTTYIDFVLLEEETV